MVLTNIEFDETVRIQEALKPTIQNFQTFISTHNISQNSLTEAWELYRDFTDTRAGVYEQEVASVPSYVNQCYEAANQRFQVIYEVTDATTIDPKSATLFKTLFLGDTQGSKMGPPGFNLGILLKGLENDKPKLMKAIAFCDAMNELGLPQSFK